MEKPRSQYREIKYTESDGSNRNQVVFYKSDDQPLVTNFKVLQGDGGGEFTRSPTYSFFKEVFLPQGFPRTVHKDYVSYQIWDTLQAFSSTVNGTLTTHSIMKGVGVGESTATPLAAAITWILKDGTGMVGRIIFAWWQGNNLGSQCKRWRLFADILNDAAMTLEVLVPYVFSISSYVLCLTTGMKAIVGIAGGATRTSIMQHHAINDNMADVSAKEHSQGTLVNLAGSAVGILILLLLNDKFFIYLCFLLVVIHVGANYFAVTSLEIETLNEERLCLIIQDYIIYHDISSVENVNHQEPVLIRLNKLSRKIFGFDFEVGASFERVLKMNLVVEKDVRYLLNILQSRHYLPVMDLRGRKIYVILSKDASDNDIIRAYYHSCIYAIIASRITGQYSETLAKRRLSPPSYPMMRILMFPERFSMFLKENDVQVSAEFVSAVDEVVTEDCRVFIKLLESSDWTVKSNMLPVKPWRGSWMQS